MVRSSILQSRRTLARKTTRSRKRKSLPRPSGADRPGPSRPKSSTRLKASRSSSSLQSNGIQARRCLMRGRPTEVPAANAAQPAARTSPDLAKDNFEVRTFSFQFRPWSLARLALELANFLRRNRIRIDPVNFLIFANCFACFSGRGERFGALQMGGGFVL